MTILTKATQIRNNVPVPSAGNATDIIAVVGDWVVPAGFAATNVVELGAIPAGYVPVDLIVDHAALARALRANPGMLAILDVHEPEPIEASNPLLGLPNAHLAPHLASRTDAAMEAMSWVVRDGWEAVKA